MLAVLRVTKAKKLSLADAVFNCVLASSWVGILKRWYCGVAEHRLTVVRALLRGFILLSQWYVFYLEGGL